MSSILTDIDLDTTMLLLPEILMLLGIVAMILIPNLGDATMRIPLTRTRVPIFIGGTRSEFSNNPKLPNTIASGVLGLALLTSFLYLGEEADVGNALHIDEFSRLFTLLFTSALLLATLATSTRMPAKPKACLLYTSDAADE